MVKNKNRFIHCSVKKGKISLTEVKKLLGQRYTNEKKEKVETHAEKNPAVTDLAA